MTWVKPGHLLAFDSLDGAREEGQLELGGVLDLQGLVHDEVDLLLSQQVGVLDSDVVVLQAALLRELG